MMILSLLTISVMLVNYPIHSAALVGLTFVLIRIYPINEGRSENVRSFFGVHKVLETSDGRFRILLNGSTIHGAQRLLSDDGKPLTGRPEPLTYYHKKSAMAAAIAAVRERKGAPLNVAVIGLGAGSLSCYAAPDENWRFFEIDPAVVAIATDPRRFTFISSCAPNLQIVVGDARLTIAKETDCLYDLIIVDAYSSDAIPVHLANQEAMNIYKTQRSPHVLRLLH